MAKDKKLLILTYYFPPLGGVGVQRVSKFCKYLPDFGWDPVVVAPKPAAFYMTDEEMVEEVKNAEINRVKAPDSFKTHQRLTGRHKPRIDSPLRKLFRTLIWPDTHKGFAKEALIAACDLSVEVNAILVTAPPWSNLLQVPGLKIETGLPVIVDMRDPWVNHPLQGGPSRKRRKNLLAEREVMKAADAVIGVTRAHTEDLKKRYPEFADSVYYIPNGYDPDDFTRNTLIRKNRTSVKRRLTIVYTGILGLEGINDGKTLYAALRILRDEDGVTPSDLRFEIIGEVSRKERKRLYGIEEFIECPGFLPHREAMHRLAEADLAYLPYHAAYSRLIVPAKTYEYAGSGTPLLAEVSQDHETAALVKETGTGLVVDEGDVDSVVDALRLLLAGRFPYKPVKHAIGSFDRKKETEELVRIVEDLM